MKTPKTPIEFDYDLWTTEDGKCMARVKCTGEETEVDRSTMRILRAEEKKLRRSKTGVPISGCEDEITKMLEEELRSSLTKYQLDIYTSCIIGDMTFKDYAEKRGTSPQSIQYAVSLIRKKAKNIF
jgi:hypothetical protein